MQYGGKIARHSHKTDTMSVRTYNAILGLLILYGFVANAIIVAISGDIFFSMSPIVFVIAYFVVGIVGIFMTKSSGNPAVSFIGYNLLVLPIGALLSICLKDYSGIDILSAIVVTGIVVVAMLVLAILGRTLFFALVVGLIGETIAIILGYGGNIFNWAFVIIFSLYLGYDWCKAQAYSKTLDNAIDSAMDIYLDIINLFVRIL